MTPHCLTTRFTPLPMIFLALFALILQGCGDGVRVLSSDADPTGYYIDVGTASVDNGDGGTISITDMQAMVDGNRIMMMSTANGLLYDGSITNISGNSFTADFMIYARGRPSLTATAKASGTIIAGSSIIGTLTGSGVGNGTFSLLYATTNNEAADIARIENEAGVNATWEAKVGGSFFAQELIIDNMGEITTDSPPAGGIFTSCELDGTLISISGSSLYRVSVVLTGCGSSTRDGTYTGLATSRTDATIDDTLVFAAVVEGYSMDGDFK